MAAFLNACRFNPTAGGTTDWTYSSAVNGYQSPGAAGAVSGRLYKYRAESADLSQWEIGEGSWNSGTGVLSRTAVLFNSSGTTSKINFSTVPQVAVVAIKEDLISISEANSFTSAQRAQARENIGLYLTTALAASQDFNSATTPGFYYTVDSSSTNAPTAGSYWYLEVSVYGAGPSANRTQRAWRLDSGVPDVSVRNYASAAWGAWRKVSFEDANGYRGHLLGEASNGNAASGEVGELIEYSLGSTSLTSAAATVNLANGAFSGGDWDIFGFIHINAAGATSLSNYTFSLSTTSATHNTALLDRFIQYRNAGGHSDPIITEAIGPFRLSVSGSTTVYLTASASFSSTLSVASKIRGRRMR
jgi:hypothetical protein